jgi:hypothetical protein
MKTESIESLLSEIVSLPSPGTNEDAVQRLVHRRARRCLGCAQP